MKKTPRVLLYTCVCMLFVLSMEAQDSPKKNKETVVLEEDEGPIMFKFEPDFQLKNDKRKSEIALTKNIIDSLAVSDRKRLKLLRDLYKNGVSKRLKRALLAENTYEDIEE